MGERWGEAVYAFVCCLPVLGAAGPAAAYALKQPLLFPCLGPMAVPTAGIVLLTVVGAGLRTGSRACPSGGRRERNPLRHELARRGKLTGHMSYLQFHAVFVVPPILMLLLAGRGLPAVPHGRGVAALGLALMALVALVYTTPWDSYLVARGAWGYGEGRVVGTLWRVPIEEYLFFVLQTLLAGLWLYRLLSRRGRPLAAKAHPAARWAGTALWLASGVSGALLLRWEPGLYLGLILAWASPVLALQWAYGGRLLWHARGVLLPGVVVPTLYLWVVDRLAIGLGIWGISERYTTGVAPFGLPIEEMVFFAVTTLMVVQGLLLFLWLYGRLRERRTHASANANANASANAGVGEPRGRNGDG